MTATNRRVDAPDRDEITIGTTPLTSRGYFVRVSRIFFEGKGSRVRLTLLQEVGSVTEYLHHLDLTTTLVSGLIPLLKKAVEP